MFGTDAVPDGIRDQVEVDRTMVAETSCSPGPSAARTCPAGTTAR